MNLQVKSRCRITALIVHTQQSLVNKEIIKDRKTTDTETITVITADTKDAMITGISAEITAVTTETTVKADTTVITDKAGTTETIVKVGITKTDVREDSEIITLQAVEDLSKDVLNLIRDRINNQDRYWYLRNN
jgi:hypothetical protein